MFNAAGYFSADNRNTALKYLPGGKTLFKCKLTRHKLIQWNLFK
jgi:hypothetical protein